MCQPQRPLETEDAQRAAPVADAPLDPGWRLAMKAFSVLTLAAITLFILYLFGVAIEPQWSRKLEAKMVAKSLVAVPSPADGRFVAARPLQNGERVRQGQILGELDAPRLAAQIDALWRRRRRLLERKLAIGFTQESRVQFSDAQREFRQVVMDMFDTEDQLARLLEIRDRTTIVSPANGRVHHGLASMPTSIHQTLASIYPDGGALVVEIQGRLADINQLIRRGTAQVVIATANGDVKFAVWPSAATLKTESRRLGNRTRHQIWATIQCDVEAIPAAARTPGLQGHCHF